MLQTIHQEIINKTVHTPKFRPAMFYNDCVIS